MKIDIGSLEGCAAADGVVVVIDVLRAFSTAAFALAAGAARLILVSSVEEALDLRSRIPDSLAMGEVGGMRAPGFDLGNSPAEVLSRDLRGRTLIHRTSAGTQGVVRAERATHLFGASFVCAAATARAVLALEPQRVTLVASGLSPDDPAEEDVACAEYLTLLLKGRRPDPQRYLQRVSSSQNADKFLDPAQPEFSSADLALCTQLDRFDFAMPVRRVGSLLELTGS
ncbi:phosphosulfolactate phosphohydrolase [Longilinea arvoryzae]|uniref:Probable 2-phosphosulfolactate phosphatase n=1 Tax=Longilinea arvoryzae TaxID=360412 RepID=A0A0S7BGX1_9CHLR|nr:2-phosphosulfolactate phosphatase [Longilinea arvoryzae]GAP13099.1 phosphosulfolactate phosphohydrolase [Longilinea arvoryzae]